MIENLAEVERVALGVFNDFSHGALAIDSVKYNTFLLCQVVVSQAVNRNFIAVQDFVKVEGSFNQTPFIDAPETLHHERGHWNVQRHMMRSFVRDTDFEREASRLPAHQFVNEF